MTQNDALREIKSITRSLIENGLSIQEKFPTKNGNRIEWDDQVDVSIALRNVPYRDKYNALESGKNFNIKMLDGALLQFMYEFDRTGRKLVSHRLAFFPSPHVERYDDTPEDYENEKALNSEFIDMIEKNSIAFPIRFDYNTDHFVTIEHPYSHVSLGEYEYCRIPVSCPVTPSIFINFIIRNFYNYALRKRGVIVPQTNLRFQNCIDESELGIIHFNII